MLRAMTILFTGSPQFHSGGQHHAGRMEKTDDPVEIIKLHMQNQNFEFRKLKAAFDELVQTMGGMGTYGIEDEKFQRTLQPMQKAVQGQVSDPSQLAALQKARDFRATLNNPVQADLSGL